MIAISELIALIQQALPDATVDVIDRTGMSDHFGVRVVSAQFQGVGPMDRHRLVYNAVTPALQDGRLHAIEIKTEIPVLEETPSSQ